MSEKDLKRQLMEIAGFLAVGEAITADDASAPLPAFVDVLVSQCHDNPVRLALMATTLARYIADPASNP